MTKSFGIVSDGALKLKAVVDSQCEVADRPSERRCPCGTILSRYNTDARCFPCQDERRRTWLLLEDA